jgi:hypothetical protein
MRIIIIMLIRALGSSRKDPHCPHRENFCRPEGREEKFVSDNTVVTVLGHLKGVTSMGGMDV